MAGRRVAIVGSGFAGSVLARVLARQGHAVTLVERGRHPRFALGESSTPLAALSLERLAARYDLPDLHDLAAYGRWTKWLPHLRRGLKRGFTFYAHRPGEPYRNGPGNDRRLLVAASPADAVADSHWLREDVDHHLAQRAAEAGVALLEETEILEVKRERTAWHLAGKRQGREIRLTADLLVDASGPGGFLARQLPIPSAVGAIGLQTSLVYGHFAAVPSFPEVATGADFPPGPYPDERAAVHHVLEEGWMYVLPFDHGVVSAGVVLARQEARERAARFPPERAWAEVLARYPTLAAQWGSARPVRPIAYLPLLQHRLTRAAGPGWALLPHAFCFLSPLFSTGIAWSLLAVERLALLLETHGGAELAPGLDRYGSLLAREADQVTRLVEGAYRAAGRDFDLLAAYSDLYFAAVSFAEIRQRLFPAQDDGEDWAWQGFLGSTDPVLGAALDRTLAELDALPPGPLPEAEKRCFAAAVGRAIAPRNLAGLADPARNRLYPVDLAPLLAGAPLLGLSEAGLRQRIDRLRGASAEGTEVWR